MAFPERFTTAAGRHPAAETMFLLILSLLFLAAPARAQTLAETERCVNGSLRVLASLADYEEAEAYSERFRAVSGLKAIGTFGFSKNAEPDSPTLKDKVHYNQLTGRVGFALPLVGGWAKETLAKLEADARVAITRQELEASRSAALAALRKAWVTRWIEARKRAVISAYLHNEKTVEAALKKRLDAKLILLYQYQNVMSTYDLARLEMERSWALEERALTVFRITLGSEIPLNELAEPDLPIPQYTPEISEYIRRHHPEVRDLHEAAEILARQGESARLVDYNFRLEGTAGVTKDNPGYVGNNWKLMLNFEVPIGAMRSGRAYKRAVDANAERARYNAEIRREELIGYLSEAFRAWTTAQKSQERFISQLNVTTENLRAALVRSSEFSDTALEQILDARLVHFTVCLNALDTVAQYMEAVTDIFHFAPGMEKAACELRRESLAERAQAERILNLSGSQTLMVALPERRSRVDGDDAAPDREEAPSVSRRTRNERSSSSRQGAGASARRDGRSFSERGDMGGRSSPGPLDSGNNGRPLIPPFQPSELKLPAESERSLLPFSSANRRTKNGAAAPFSDIRQNDRRAYGVYVWDARPFLGTGRKEELARLIDPSFTSEIVINRILLSLNAGELKQVARHPQILRALLDDAHAMGLRVELLLGDPEWILPERRRSLFSLIESLSEFPFDGLHLDLEQDQLPGAAKKRNDYALFTATTLVKAAEISPWPVGFSIHHRYLDPKGPTPWFVGRLAGVSFSEATVMAYITNTKNLIPLLSRIAGAAPGMNVTLACSVEEILPPESSHMKAGRAIMHKKMNSVRDSITAENFNGVLIQSWEEFKRTDK